MKVILLNKKENVFANTTQRAPNGHVFPKSRGFPQGAIMPSMSKLDEAERLLAELTRSEKAQLLQWVARDLGDAFPGVESNPNICGGEPCIIRTRIPVWLLEQARRLGTTEAELLQSYPTLRAEDLANAWSFVRAHRSEIDRQIAENEAA
jgi:uncharacterized protein (DUF433 family)